MTTTESTTATEMKLETETCSRCGGSGNYSYCQRFGTKCFKCMGAGKALTKRGAVAAAYLETLRSKRADAVVVGDWLWMGGVPGYISGRWYKVESVKPSTSQVRAWIGCVEVPQRTDALDFEGTAKDGTHCGHNAVNPETIVRVGQTAEQKRATLEIAVAYQATLTKTGTVRKIGRAKKEAA